MNFNLNLSNEKNELLDKLVKNTNESKEDFLNEILNHGTTWEDLEDYNYILEKEKNPNLRFLDKEEASLYLDQLFLNKQSCDLQT